MTKSSEVLPVAIALLSEHVHECIVTLMNKRHPWSSVQGGALHNAVHSEIAVRSEQLLLLGCCSR